MAALVIAVRSSNAETLTDSFASRPVTTGPSAEFTGDSTNADVEIGEPTHGGSRKRSVWGAWTAPGPGNVTIASDGSDFDTVLAIYVGSEVGALLPVAQNNNVQSGFNTSRVSFPVKTGETYSIALDGFPNNSSGDGLGVVRVAFAPASQPDSEVGTDVFALRPALPSAAEAIGVADTRIADIELDEKDNIGAREQTVWWRWAAPANGKVTIDTIDSNFDTALTVYAGGTLTALSEVAINNDAPNVRQSRISFRTLAGQEYQILVDGFPNNSAGEGNVILRLNFEARTGPGAIPGADAFARRGLLSGRTARGVANNRYFTEELDEPNHPSFREQTAWWQWTAPADGDVRIRTEGSDFDTYLVVYRGESIANLRSVYGNNDKANVKWSKARFFARAGRKYQIMVDGYPRNSVGYGNIALTLDQPPGQLIARARAGTYHGSSGEAFLRVTVNAGGAFTLAGSVGKDRLRAFGRMTDDDPETVIATDGRYVIAIEFDPQNAAFEGSIRSDGEIVALISGNAALGRQRR
jgi:hypothetical protein